MATGLEQESLSQGPALSARQGGPGGTASRSWAPESRAKRCCADWQGLLGRAPGRCSCRCGVCLGFRDDYQDLGDRGLMWSRHTRSTPLPGILYQPRPVEQLVSEGSSTGQGSYRSRGHCLPRLCSQLHPVGREGEWAGGADLVKPCQTLWGTEDHVPSERGCHLVVVFFL